MGQQKKKAPVLKDAAGLKGFAEKQKSCSPQSSKEGGAVRSRNQKRSKRAIITKPDFHDYYMNIAIAVREKANCLGRKVSAVIVKENRIISTGYKGTPEG
jgi:deoxycytidylate deaminase